MKPGLLKKIKAVRKSYFTVSDLEKLFGLKRKSLYVALSRLLAQGWLKRLRKGIYQLSDVPSDVERIANQLYRPSYLSFESAMSRYGILSQIPFAVSFATPRRSKRVSVEGTEVEFRQIKKELFKGFHLKEGLFIAEPEKALMDQLYLTSLGKASIDPQGLNLREISKKKLLQWSALYPSRAQSSARALLK